ncbi:MAG: GMC family oxidoreductase N-terminal domain-containing protein [Pseudomonadota bacterium]
MRADGEVLLCAGAVRSPQILQLSGIGPEKVTAAQGITVRHVSPEVGENLQDHVQMRTIVEMSYAWASLNKHVLNPLKLAEMAL